MLELAGCPQDSPELVQCKQRLAKAKQSSAYVAQLEIPDGEEAELAEVQKILATAMVEEGIEAKPDQKTGAGKQEQEGDQRDPQQEQPDA
jgi:hypothetical protein